MSPKLTIHMVGLLRPMYIPCFFVEPSEDWSDILQGPLGVWAASKPMAVPVAVPFGSKGPKYGVCRVSILGIVIMGFGYIPSIWILGPLGVGCTVYGGLPLIQMGAAEAFVWVHMGNF